MTKQCRKCLIQKPNTDFGLDKRQTDGLNRMCKKCCNNQFLEWKQNNRERWREHSRNKVKNNPLKYYKRRELCAKLASDSNRYNKSIGCSPIELRQYIESLFKEDMNWNNKGTIWHLDHIIPYGAFTEEDQIYINHYLNLQPIYCEENFKKSNIWTQDDKIALIENAEKLRAAKYHY